MSSYMKRGDWTFYWQCSEMVDLVKTRQIEASNYLISKQFVYTQMSPKSELCQADVNNLAPS